MSASGGEPDRSERASENAANRPIELKVALVAVISTLLGAVIGGLFSYLTAHEQINAQGSLAASTFLRDQERIAYGQMMKDAFAFDATQNEYYRLFSEDQAPSSGTADGGYRRLEDAWDKLPPDLVVVQLVGSKAAADIAELMLKNDGQRLADASVSRIYLPPSSQRQAEATKALLLGGLVPNSTGSGAAAAETRAQADFITQARKDLDNTR